MEMGLRAQNRIIVLVSLVNIGKPCEGGGLYDLEWCLYSDHIVKFLVKTRCLWYLVSHTLFAKGLN